MSSISKCQRKYLGNHRLSVIKNCLWERKDFAGRSCSNAMLSQEVWVSLRLCISKKLQERQVLLALASPSESEGRRSQQENGGSLGVRGAVFKKILHKKEKM